MKIGVISLGCPKNLVDSEVMLGIIKENNWHITDKPEEAELLIVNTCGFITAAKEESINTLLQMAEYKKAGSCKHLLLTGCLGQRYAQELFEQLPEVDAIVGTEAYEDIATVIKRIIDGDRFIYLKEVQAYAPHTKRLLTTPQYFAYLKIAEGCDNCCSYCAIPQIRGPYRSRPYEDVIAEARELAKNGVKELILVAQDTTRYGEDLYGRLRLPELLRELNAIEELLWIRVLYCYPQYFNDELIETFRNCEKICKYIDIPLQHVSDSLLASMNRYDTRTSVEALLTKIRREIPDVYIRTTFIVGFPGETDAQFAELKDFVTQQRFNSAGVFTYSQEDGTVAGQMPNQIEESIKEERYHELMSLQAAISEELQQKREGCVLEVVIEGFDEDNPLLAVARSEGEAPDVDSKLFIENAAGLVVGEFVKVRVLQGFTYEAVAELAE